MTMHGSSKSSSSYNDYCPPFCIEIDGVETTVAGVADVAPADPQDPIPACTWVFGDFTLEEFEDATVIFRDNAGVKIPFANIFLFQNVLKNGLDFQGIHFEDCKICPEKCISIDGKEVISKGVPLGGNDLNNLPVCSWPFTNPNTGVFYTLSEYFGGGVSFFQDALRLDFPNMQAFEAELDKPIPLQFAGASFKKCIACVERCISINGRPLTEEPTFIVRADLGRTFCKWGFEDLDNKLYTLSIDDINFVQFETAGVAPKLWNNVQAFEAELALGFAYDNKWISECGPCPAKCVSINGENITDEGEELGGDALNGLPVCQWIFPLAAGGSYTLNEFFNGSVELEESPLNIRQFQNMQDFDLKLGATIQFDGKEFTECDPCPEKCLRIDNDEITVAGQQLGGNANNLLPKCRWDFGDYILEEFVNPDGAGFKVFIQKLQGGAIEGYANMDDFDAAVNAGVVHNGDIKECIGCGKKCIAINSNDLTSFGFDGGGDALNGEPVCYYNFDGYKLSIFFNGSVQLSKGPLIVKPFNNIGDFNQQLAAGFPFNGDLFSDCVGCPTKCVQINDCDQLTSDGEAKGGNSTNGIAVCQWTFGIYTLDEYFDKTVKLSVGALELPFINMADFDQELAAAAGITFNGDNFSECENNCGEICVNLNGNYITAQGEYGGGTANNSIKCVWKIGSFIEYTLEEYCDGQVFLRLGSLERGYSNLDQFKEDLVGAGFTFNNDQFQECLPCPNKCVNIDYQDFNSAGTQGAGAQGNQLPVCSWQFDSYELWELFDGSVILYFGSNQKPFVDMDDFNNQLQQEFVFQGQVFAVCGTEPPNPSSSYNPFNFSVALEDYQIACCNPSKILITSGEPWDGWQNINSNCTYDKTSVSEDLSQDEYYQYILYWNNEIQSWAFQGTTMNWTQENEFYGSTDPCNPEGEYSDGNKKLLISVI